MHFNLSHMFLYCFKIKREDRFKIMCLTYYNPINKLYVASCYILMTPCYINHVPSAMFSFRFMANCVTRLKYYWCRVIIN